MTNVYLLTIQNGHGPNEHYPCYTLDEAVQLLFDFISGHWDEFGMGDHPEEFTWDDASDFFADTSLFPEVVHLYTVGENLRAEVIGQEDLELIAL